MTPGVEAVLAHRARERGHGVHEEVRGEGGGRLLRPAVIDAGVSRAQLEAAQRGHVALAHGRRVGGVAEAVVVGWRGCQRPEVERVPGVVDADPGATAGVATGAAHQAAAALADEEEAIRLAVVEAQHLAFVIGRRAGLSHDMAVVVAPVGTAVVGLDLDRASRFRCQLVE